MCVVTSTLIPDLIPYDDVCSSLRVDLKKMEFYSKSSGLSNVAPTESFT